MTSADPKSWPSWTLESGDLIVLEALLRGWYRPLKTLDSQERRERDARPENPARYSIKVSSELAASLHQGERLALRDPEGAVVAAIQIEHVDPTGGVSGTVIEIERAHHDEYPALWLSPEEVAERWKTRAPRAIVHFAGPSADAAVWHAVADHARWLDAAIVVLLPSGSPGLDGGLDLLRLRALHDDAIALDGIVVMVPMIAVDPWDDPERVVSAAIAAGASFLTLDVRGRGAEDVARLTSMATGAGLRLIEVRSESRPDEGGKAHVPAAFGVGRGFTVFLTGLSGSGKSTIARALRARLIEGTGRPVSLLDGDLVRRHLSSELGFSREHRDLHVRRIGWVASEIVRHGGMAICAPIAPYDATRRAIREMIAPHGGFLLVHVATPLETCEARDRKGLYAKARAGLVPNFTGISDPYEAPADASLVIDTREVSVEDACRRIVERLVAEGWLTTGS